VPSQENRKGSFIPFADKPLQQLLIGRASKGTGAQGTPEVANERVAVGWGHETFLGSLYSNTFSSKPVPYRIFILFKRIWCSPPAFPVLWRIPLVLDAEKLLNHSVFSQGARPRWGVSAALDGVVVLRDLKTLAGDIREPSVHRQRD
jgi:hypothetical protein